MPDFSNLLEQNFKADTFKGEKRLTIRDCRAEEIGQEKTPKPVLYFTEDTRGLVLNTTNFKRIVEAVGSNLSEDWAGWSLILYVEKDVKFGNRTVAGLRVKDVQPPKKSK